MEGVAPPSSCQRPMSAEKKTRPQEQLNCPRCNSTNSKFCYYNNYSLTQPRYFCKTCRKYWTAGGTLRNVPVGGGSRKNKKVMVTANLTSSSSSSSSTSNIPDLNPPSFPHSQNPKSHGGQDLNLEFPIIENYHHGMPHYVEVPRVENNPCVHHHHHHHHQNSSSNSALELLRSGMATRGLIPYIPTLMPDSNTLYSSGLQELKSNLDFSVDHGIGSTYPLQKNTGRHVFPFGEMKHQLSASNEVQQHTEIGFWNGVVGEGSW